MRGGEGRGGEADRQAKMGERGRDGGGEREMERVRMKSRKEAEMEVGG